MHPALQRLADLAFTRVRFSEPLAPYTTWRIGGPADALVDVGTPEELVRLFAFLREEGIPWFLLGHGSNVLFGDGGFRGVVFRLAGAFRTLAILSRGSSPLVFPDGRRGSSPSAAAEGSPDGSAPGRDARPYEGAEVGWEQGGDVPRCPPETVGVLAGGGASLPGLAAFAARRGLAGLEFAGGIPGTVGGAVVMNAGAHGGEVKDVLRYVRLFTPDGREVVAGPESLRFSYRTSNLQREKAVVVEAAFCLRPDDPEEIRARLNAFRERRARTQPVTARTAGSVFRNPPGDYAGRLIDAAGLKGLRVGGAVVSPVHANFIENAGGATARDVCALIERIRDEVYRKFGVLLETEVVVVGEG
ncbi:MAG: UDP-N-acetylenolpyruvoylglucosamine reductase [Brockia lithotrophica]|uniref:UDP-N-acetylenolpyruvoylglucosamine reductase n=1 Tax=Brockia lithotrophica TaxID=933949 RepID=A0A2T5G8E9_9BACL|nr:UDP-N-acetylmuramate dehydrogenase [Brockia lithotrophica]PTQ52460.1 MAG: UDP-N-acetylenolpyruvoylglucosamine reductase [Brockia lithotrophica]